MNSKRIVPSALVLAFCLGPTLVSAQYTPPPPEVAEYRRVPEQPTYPPPEVRVDPGPFGRNRISFGVWAGTTFTGDQTYLKLGASIGYNLVDGLRLSFGSTFWFFDDPFVATLTPDLTYTFHFVQVVKPYLGTFYSHYIVGDGFDDYDSIGAHAGINFVPNNLHMYFGVGLVYERLLDCNSNIFECDDVYPELNFAFVL